MVNSLYIIILSLCYFMILDAKPPVLPQGHLNHASLYRWRYDIGIIKGGHRIGASPEGILCLTVAFYCMTFKIHQNCHKGFSFILGKFHHHRTIPSETTAKESHKTVPSCLKTNMIGHNHWITYTAHHCLTSASARGYQKKAILTRIYAQNYSDFWINKTSMIYLKSVSTIFGIISIYIPNLY